MFARKLPNNKHNIVNHCYSILFLSALLQRESHGPVHRKSFLETCAVGK